MPVSIEREIKSVTAKKLFLDITFSLLCSECECNLPLDVSHTIQGRAFEFWDMIRCVKILKKSLSNLKKKILF